MYKRQIDAPILSLDADTWVEPNYLEEVVRYFQEKSVAGVSIAYAHRLEEADMTVQAREAIMKYELYLRYYRLALEYTGHPHAYHCIGSAFAVRTLDYVCLLYTSYLLNKWFLLRYNEENLYMGSLVQKQVPERRSVVNFHHFRNR